MDAYTTKEHYVHHHIGDTDLNFYKLRRLSSYRFSDMILLIKRRLDEGENNI